ncbi:thiamine pyrophosphate-binding protein [Turicibacter sanguinis]|uniref:thiamine pyrophosphate-binding protein n=1 Tax=Turicibacter sanguinis TaxID=154288 RepID=UPI0018A95CB2|nr:thiamine pyrophosphate-binding protein [Turicibacter sanguinis]MDB8566197.1 thiamine pyrophosphate-binding protein [Turicibacter sanguinis]MDB8568939.1 thiamine pyrophosphate-binding protein [Turicibacter sanguinis]MDB8571698.1 thiamine pyrophosphate-binding protein [Turicibacter sanguinis]MDB8580448.1 thiamine pyrophosphate-binding protein [Turicibacter sanguinis]
MKVSDYIVNYFERKKIRYIFGYMGGMITHLANSIDKNSYTQFIQVYHEQTAAFAAEGYARETNQLGVAISTSGPGATNMITDIANAYFDSIPVIYITGQVNTQDYKYDLPIRQQGFQETDIISIVTPITKYAVLINDERQIRYELEKAYYIATTGKKGPVLLDIPLNIQRAEISVNELPRFIPDEGTVINDRLKIREISTLIQDSKQPLILAGAGVMELETKQLLIDFVKQTGIPVVNSLMAKGCIPDIEFEAIGMLGSYGKRCANMLVPESDLLIVLGSRLDTRQTGNLLSNFHPNGNIIHVNISQEDLDYHRLGKRIKLRLSVEAFIKELQSALNGYTIPCEWRKKVKVYKELYSQEKEIELNVENKSPYEFVGLLNRYTKKNDIFTVDIGQNQMWCAQYLRMKEGQKFYTSGGLAPMGYALPAAIGVAFANPNQSIFSICGDGGFLISLQALMLISQYNLPIKVIVFNNRSLGMITQFQSLYFDGQYTGTTEETGYRVPDIEAIAKAYALNYFKVTQDQMKNSDYLDSVFKQRNGIIEFVIEGRTTISPKLEFNRPINEPSPIQE